MAITRLNRKHAREDLMESLREMTDSTYAKFMEIQVKSFERMVYKQYIDGKISERSYYATIISCRKENLMKDLYELLI